MLSYQLALRDKTVRLLYFRPLKAQPQAGAATSSHPASHYHREVIHHLCLLSVDSQMQRAERRREDCREFVRDKLVRCSKSGSCLVSFAYSHIS